jgi:hypothetical protein
MFQAAGEDGIAVDLVNWSGDLSSANLFDHQFRFDEVRSMSNRK